jgi:hypothetical protein
MCRGRSDNSQHMSAVILQGPCGYDLCGRCGMSRHNHNSTFPLACGEFVFSDEGRCDICKGQRESERAAHSAGDANEA